MFDTLGLVVHDLRLRQLEALQAEIPDAFVDYSTRMSRAMTTGLAIVNDLVEEQPHLRDLMTQLVVLPEQDRRLSFLNGIPNGPILSMMRANALERAVFGTETRDVAELALLVGLFTILLDGLLDEAPEIALPVKPWLDKLMVPEPVDGEPPPNVHPVAAALVWAGSQAVERVFRMPGWKDATAREEFTRATRAAYRSELDSVSCHISDREHAPGEQRNRIINKSASCIWAGALIPSIVHGWPPGIDPRKFESLARSIGEFGGWCDDIVDLGSDLKADLWSMPLLEVYSMVSMLDSRLDNGGDVQVALAEGLEHPLIAGRIPSLGLLRLNQVRVALAGAGIPEEQLLPVMADVARACLLDNLIPA